MRSGWAAPAALMVLAAGAASAQMTSETGIEGLWTYQATAPALAGSLDVTQDGLRWRAQINGQRALASQEGSYVNFSFSDGSAFRGMVDASGLTGFWLHPAVNENPDLPQTFATPVRLRETGRHRWQGQVHPPEDSFTLYLSIFHDANGALKAAFRNPERNSHGPAMQLTLVREGDALRFSAPASAARAEAHLDATLKHDPERIEMVWGDLKRTIVLSRTAVQDAVRFSARPPNSHHYVYRQPVSTGDGWRTARAGSLGMDEAALERAVQRIIDVDPAGAWPWLIHSMSIAYRGRLVLDEYFYGYGRDEPHDTRSAAKTFSSVMMGVVMREGVNISPQTRAYSLLAPLGPFANPDPRKDQITLAHLLTHTSGLACNDNDDASPGNEDTMQAQRAQPNWWKYTLDLPMEFDPGVRYAYCSANINLVGASLTQATGEWLPSLFDRTLARRLQFGTYYWNLMPNGEGYLGGGVHVRSRDFLKLGQVFLDHGAWNGRRIVSQDWVGDSVAPHAHISLATTGLDADTFNNNYWETDEGYAWHLLGVHSGNQTYPAYFANGNGGQLLLVVPQFDLAVMFYAGNYGQGVWNRERDDIVGGMIIPAIRR